MIGFNSWNRQSYTFQKNTKIFCVLDVHSRFYSLKYVEDLFYGKYLSHAVLQYIFYFWISIIHFWISVIISVLALWTTKLGLYWADAQTYLSLCYTDRQVCLVLRCSGSFIYTVNSHISKIDISKYPLISKNIVGRIPYFLHFSSCYSKLVVSQSKFSGTRNLFWGSTKSGWT